MRRCDPRRRAAVYFLSLVLFLVAANIAAKTPAKGPPVVLSGPIRPPRAIIDIAYRGKLLYFATQASIAVYDCGDCICATSSNVYATAQWRKYEC